MCVQGSLITLMHTDNEKDSLITFAGFGKQTGSVASGSSASSSSDAGIRKTQATAAATVSATSSAGVFILLVCSKEFDIEQHY